MCAAPAGEWEIAPGVGRRSRPDAPLAPVFRHYHQPPPPRLSRAWSLEAEHVPGNRVREGLRFGLGAAAV